MDRTELEAYIADAYSVEADDPWEDGGASAVFRHGDTGKWFAVALRVQREKLGVEGTGLMDIVNVKCDPVAIGSFRMLPGIFPAYHMSKTNWVSLALDGSVGDEHIRLLLDMSYDLTKSKRKKQG